MTQRRTKYDDEVIVKIMDKSALILTLPTQKGQPSSVDNQLTGLEQQRPEVKQQLEGELASYKESKPWREKQEQAEEPLGAGDDAAADRGKAEADHDDDADDDDDKPRRQPPTRKNRRPFE